NISAVIRHGDVAKALNALHEAFFLSDRKVLNVFLVGTGLIGKVLLKMIRDQFTKLANESLLEINVVAVANSRRMLFREEGLNPETCVAELSDSSEPMEMKEFVNTMVNLNLTNSIFVDCTSSEEVTNFYEQVLDANI